MNEYVYTIRVTTDTRSQADHVLAERLMPDEDYIFKYTIAYKAADGPEYSTLGDTPLEVRCINGMELESVTVNGDNTRARIAAARTETLYVREPVELTFYESELNV